MKQRKFLAYGSVGLGIFGLTIFLGWWQVDGPGAKQTDAFVTRSLSSMEFRLIDHNARPVGPDKLLGQASLIFFGFTYCPDICPTTLSDISTWLAALGDKANELNVVFITVDPMRDTTDVIAEYVNNFHPAIQGWTGSMDQIARAADGFGISYTKVVKGGAEYTMDHTANILLLNSAGKLVSTIDYHESKETAVPKIRRVLN